MNACPHPSKVRYLDEVTATKAAETIPEKLNRRIGNRKYHAPAKYPYRCQCGLWHLATVKE